MAVATVRLPLKVLLWSRMHVSCRCLAREKPTNLRQVTRHGGCMCEIAQLGWVLNVSTVKRSRCAPRYVFPPELSDPCGGTLCRRHMPDPNRLL